MFVWDNEENEDIFFDAVEDHGVGDVAADYDDVAGPQEGGGNDEGVNGVYIKSFQTILTGIIKRGATINKQGSK